MELIDRIHQVAKELGMDRRIPELANRLINDQRPVLEHAYVFGQTEDNEQSSFQAARAMQQEGIARKFWVIEGIEAEGFPGYQAWHERFGSMVGTENVASLPFPTWVQKSFWMWEYCDIRTKNLIRAHCNVNTLSESQSLVEMAVTSHVPALYVVSPQFHFLRACMTVMSEAINASHRGHNVRIFNYLGTSLPWEETVIHSQGTQEMTRAQLVRKELEKIPSYKNILPVKDIMEYIDKRTLPQK
ncbi:hypothetical protein HYU18_04300 [Candidatus Woesearchaeota archaeon]|nr:hypothetical protein [Candidatus Woesearchaeota archaeon]